MVDALLAWWQAHGWAGVALVAVAAVLYARLGERAWTLARIHARRRAVNDRRRVAAAGGSGMWVAAAASAAEARALAGGFTLIRCLIVALPLIGLLGTVAGMIEAFAAIGACDGGAVAARASRGISLALGATQQAIALALPALVAELWLRRRAAALAAAHADAVRRPLGAAA
jgi:biopolymer transport protein ExbB/TolQ